MDRVLRRLASRPWYGRDRELAELRQRLETPASVGILGPPGIGKSRLAAEVARSWPGEVLWCSLEGAGDAEQVAERVGRAMGLQGPAAGRALAGRTRALLVLDEAERAVQGGMDELLEGWREQAPELRCLLTSRQRPGAAIEPLILGPLSLEAAEALYLERAGAVDPRIELERGPLRELLEALDRLPLAIELAAARVQLFPPPLLLAQLPGALSDRRREGRHRSLQDALAMSWELLSADHREALGACTLFPDIFEASAFHAVTQAAPELLEELLDASLVELTSAGCVRLLQTVRSFASERAPPSPERARRHTDWVLATVAPAVRLARHCGDWRPVETYRADLIAALAREGPHRLELALLLAELRLVAGPLVDPTLGLSVPPALALEVGLARARFLHRQADYQGALELLEELHPESPDEKLVVATLALTQLVALRRWDEAHDRLPALEGPGSPRARAEAWLARAALHQRQQEPEQALSALQQAQALTGSGELELEAQILAHLGVALRTSHYDRAAEYLRRALALFRQLGQLRWETLVAGWLAVHLHDGGDLEQAAAGLSSAAQRAARGGDAGSEAQWTLFLAQVHLERRDGEQVDGLLARSWATPSQRAWSQALGGLAALGRGDPRAVPLLEQAIADYGALGNLSERWRYRLFLALALRDEPARAERILTELDQDTDEISGLFVRLVREALAGGLSAKTRASAQQQRGFLARMLLQLADGAGLAVARDGSWFETAQGLQELARKPVLGKLLAALASAGPGELVGRTRLLAEVWPGERMSAASADARLHVAVRALRKLGVGERLVTGQLDRELAYGLSPDVRVV